MALDNRYMYTTLIGVYEMHDQVHPNYDLFALHPPQPSFFFTRLPYDYARTLIP